MYAPTLLVALVFTLHSTAVYSQVVPPVVTPTPPQVPGAATPTPPGAADAGLESTSPSKTSTPLGAAGAALTTPTTTLSKSTTTPVAAAAVPTTPAAGADAADAGVMVTSTIGGVVTVVPFVQSVSNGVLAEEPKSGSIGLGTQTGAVGIVRTHSALPGAAGRGAVVFDGRGWVMGAVIGAGVLLGSGLVMV